MNDYNNGTLQEPCLRLDYGFGEQWASVELGDGTGYVRLADYEKVAGENAKLRGLARDIERTRKALCDELGHIDLACDDCPACQVCDTLYERMRELGLADGS